jgi:tetratricopeptide (TPR) repeat protein
MKSLLLALVIAAPTLAQTTRIASDFEIRQMEQQVARSRDFLSQLSGHLNLGDLRMTRNETALARGEYQKALEIAADERLTARRASQMTRYATATSYAALAAAKLGDRSRAFALAEESLRYTSDSAKTWNLYASAMTIVQRPAKAACAARNAVAIAERDVQQTPSVANQLDLAVYRYALASSLLESNQGAEAEQLLRMVVDALRSGAFSSLQREAARTESFEIYSSARGEAPAYISLLNRSQLRLARLYEDRGDFPRARQQYQNVLAARTDDPTALAALARLSESPAERERYYAEAFDANPFSLALIRDYQRYLNVAPPPSAATGDTTGAQLRLALQQIHRNELAAALSAITALQQKFPDNDTLRLLHREIEERRAGGSVVLHSTPTGADLRAIIAAFNDNHLTPEQRAQLDKMTFTSTAVFAAEVVGAPQGQTIFGSGTIEEVPFRFSEPTAFNGTFAAGVPLRLTYRILGATQQNGADGLLIEPVRLEGR